MGYRFACVHLHTEQIPACAQTNTETKDFECCHNTAECVHVFVRLDRIYGPQAAPREPGLRSTMKITLTSFRCFTTRHSSTSENAFLLKKFPHWKLFSLSLFFNNLLYNSAVSKTVQLRYKADTQKPSNKKRGGGKSKTTGGTSLKKEEKILNTKQAPVNVEGTKNKRG